MHFGGRGKQTLYLNTVFYAEEVVVMTASSISPLSPEKTRSVYRFIEGLLFFQSFLYGFRLLPCLGSCKQCAANIGVHVSFWILFFVRIYALEWDCRVTWLRSYLILRTPSESSIFSCWQSLRTFAQEELRDIHTALTGGPMCSALYEGYG